MSDPPSYELTELTLSEKPESFPGQHDMESGLDGPTASGIYPEVLIDQPFQRPTSTRQGGYGTRPVHAAYAPSTQTQGPPVWHTGQQTTVVVNQHVPVHRPPPIDLLRTDGPTPTTCFNCGSDVITYIYYESGTCTWMACIGMAIIGCDFGCCLIPFCVDTFKDIIHKCPRCHVVLGRHKKL